MKKVTGKNLFATIWLEGPQVVEVVGQRPWGRFGHPKPQRFYEVWDTNIRTGLPNKEHRCEAFKTVDRYLVSPRTGKTPAFWCDKAPTRGERFAVKNVVVARRVYKPRYGSPPCVNFRWLGEVRPGVWVNLSDCVLV